MAKRVFYSFHYKVDNWRASQIRNIGILDGNRPASDNDWESVTKGGDHAIRRWIDNQMNGKSCVLVLIGSQTAGRKWIKYEIERAWNSGRGLLGVRIESLRDRNNYQSHRGNNPFADFNVKGQPLDRIVPVFDSKSSDSKVVYNQIAANIADWIEHAIKVRKEFS